MLPKGNRINETNGVSSMQSNKYSDRNQLDKLDIAITALEQ